MSAVTPDAAERGIYLYCLARPQCLALLAGAAAPRAVDPRYPLMALADAGAPAQLVAVISEVEIADFSEENLQTLLWVGERAGLHEAVVAGVMDACAVLPVKFGTLFRSPASLLQFMASHRDAIEQGLELLHDKAEWSVKGYLLDQDLARAFFAEEDEAVAQRRATLSQSPGARYLQQKQLDALIDKALEAGVARKSADLQQVLQAQASASATLRCHASALTGRSERMVFNASYLLSEELLDGFRQALALQQVQCQDLGLGLELRGPWPPYNFCPDLSGAALAAC